MVQWLGIHLAMQGMHVGFLARELRSYMPKGSLAYHLPQLEKPHAAVKDPAYSS